MSAQSPRPSDDRTRPGAGRPARGGLRTTVKGPLVFSAVLGLVGGVVAALTASGGTANPLRIDIGLIAFGVFFMTSLVVVAMLQLASRENPDHLSRGSGVNRSSEETFQRRAAERRAKAAAERRAAQGDAGR
ncbi:hypothetical protein KW076_02815 [Micrococcus porci]|uniref:hypothetical protein n=1 Tax=Micrococcus TaxID=1269 RepID=UPI001CCD112B|nr:hypothetical protein [Micrococcus porci]MCG7422260.1 hypothetical protein [Micrococcus sp. ACRRV]UBH25142.1 hypothetical protein KW076_02815 [Micrococcus porci]